MGELLTVLGAGVLMFIVSSAIIFMIYGAETFFKLLGC